MKYMPVLFPVAFALFSTGGVAAEWLQSSPGHTWDDYCRPGGSQLDTLHACFIADPTFAKGLLSESSFQGYHDSDFKIDDPYTVLVTNKYKVSVGFYQVETPGAPDPKCAQVDIFTREKHPRELRSDIICKGQTMALPTFLWK
ncbi:uncharacterized protein SRS1_20001 [Sporisorium reilianum f. sp. reilianum]|uniref:Mig1 protein n=1 Tax=Sporisorium reilianum f. sp. reilianum TaxID=72559 RepID=A0A2N8U9L3_9BASI|nr:uncharacterized protein SRS1_20001 [Sporisorium reilianum f. sp. reilianum]